MIKLIQDDLFKSDDSLVHCVSQDLHMGKGIAVTFKEKFGQVDKLAEQKKGIGEVAYIQSDKRYIFYLITKDKYYGKPTYKSLIMCLSELKKLCTQFNVTKLSMPKIGCGLDRLNWDKVVKLIEKHLTNIDVDIYYL